MAYIPSPTFRSLIVCSVRAFGDLYTPSAPKYGRALSHALISDFIIHRQNQGYAAACDYKYISGYVLTVMEDIDGFEHLTPEVRDGILVDAIDYLYEFIAYATQLTPDADTRLGIYTPTGSPSFVALLV